MAVDADFENNPGADGAPTNGTDPYGGAIDTGTDLDSTQSNLIIGGPLPSDPSDQVFYGSAYRRNTSAGNYTSARAYLRSGGILNSSGGTLSVVSTSALDTGNLWIAGKVSGVWTPVGTLAVTGTTASPSPYNWDITSIFLYAYLISGVLGFPAGNLVITVNGQTTAVIYGTLEDSLSACVMAGPLFQLALATAKGATIGGTNRTSAPGTNGDTSSITSFSTAVRWPGSDQSLAIPGNELATTQNIGYCLSLNIPGNFPTPPGGKLRPRMSLIGDPV